MRVIAVISLALLALGACRSGVAGKLADVPARAALAGTMLAVEAEAWRNTMPGPGGPGANDRGLFLVVRVRPAEGAALAAELHADSAWVVHGDETWAIALSEVSRDPAGALIEARADGGPRWDPKTRIDVVVSVVSASGKRIRIAARNVEITAAS